MSDTIELPQNLTIHHIEEHFNTLGEAINAAGDDIVFDASKIETIDTSGLQTLLVYVHNLSENGKNFSWTNVTDTLSSAAKKIGIDTALKF